MLFTRLDISNFRNFTTIHVDLDPGVNCFFGPNGQGKSNLLEGLYLLSRCHSFRFGANDDWVRVGAESVGAKLTTKMVTNNIVHELNCNIQVGRRRFHLNGKPASPLKVAQLSRCVLFSPESLDCIKEGPENRRNLIDQFLENSNPLFFKIKANYSLTLRNRNRILKLLKSREIERNQGLGVLDSLNELFFSQAAALSYSRVEGLKTLWPFCQEAISRLNGDFFALDWRYIVSNQQANLWSQNQFLDAISYRAQELQAAELESGISLVGPHKHDFQIYLNGKNSRTHASQGQSRILILGFKMAEIMYHIKVLETCPILFLDDVFSELDYQRRTLLIRFLRELKTQIFLTSTEPAYAGDFVGVQPKIFHLNNGQINHGVAKGC